MMGSVVGEVDVCLKEKVQLWVYVGWERSVVEGAGGMGVEKFV